MPLNNAWHSRLPDCKNAFEGWFYGAEFDGHVWAVAWWSKPVARMFNGLGFAELRRFAIREGSPDNTASRMLGWMARDIRKTMPQIVKLISYQDTAVHHGTIYKASGWACESVGQEVKTGWMSRASNRQNQSTAPKARWVLALRAPIADTLTAKIACDTAACTSTPQQGSLFADTACGSMDGERGDSMPNNL
jgi:hypothetical protein